MFTSLTSPTLRFPEGFDFEAEKSAAKTGSLDDVIVELSDSTCFSVCFVDCRRLDEEIGLAQQTGKPYFSKPGLIVVSGISTWISTLAVCWAASQDYFLHLSPTPYPPLVPGKMSIGYPEGGKAQALQFGQDRGYLEAVDVLVDDGRHYTLAFMTPLRLRQEIESDALNGRPFYVEPGLIVVPGFQDDVLQTAVCDLVRQGYLAHLKSKDK